MKRLLPAVLVIVLAACSPGASDARPGNPAVYDRIEALTDCAALQAEFDTASANHDRDSDAGKIEQMEWDTGYMQAADRRMKDIGCY